MELYRYTKNLWILLTTQFTYTQKTKQRSLVLINLIMYFKKSAKKIYSSFLTVYLKNLYPAG
jgi:hypothetical protein